MLPWLKEFGNRFLVYPHDVAMILIEGLRSFVLTTLALFDHNLIAMSSEDYWKAQLDDEEKDGPDQ